MSKIAVIGLVGESVFLTVDRHQNVGESITANSIHREWGGKGYNQAVAAARFGAEVSFLGAVSSLDAEEIFREAKSDGISAILAIGETPTAYGVIVTDKTGDNRVTVYPGASLTVGDLAIFSESIKSADILLINNEVPEEVNIAAVKIAKEAGKTVIFNPAPVRETSEYILENSDIITPNQHEADALGNRKNMIVTIGKDGCLIKDSGTVIPTFDTGHPLDTTGAGDTFTGTLAAALAEGYSLTAACRVANAAASIETTRKFVMPAIPRREETLALYNSSQN